jgi:hypothetical protein
MISPDGEKFNLSDCEVNANLLNTFESTVKDKKLNSPRPADCSVYSQPKQGSKNEKVKNAINDILINESLKLYPADQTKSINSRCLVYEYCQEILQNRCSKYHHT